MLIEFKFRNFKSFKDESKFLMTSVKSFKEHTENIITTGREEFNLLKSAAVYGMNASGKSSFTLAIGLMANVVFNSFFNSLRKEEERPIQDNQFKLSSTTEKANTMVEVSFLVNSEIFRYGFEINGYEIKEEWLYRKKDREVRLFIRKENNEFEYINPESFKEGIKYKDEVNLNVLFISHLSQHNQKISKIITDWFNNVHVISGLHEHNYDKYTATLLKHDPNFKKWASLVLKYLEISAIEAGEKDGEIITYHNKYDEHNILIDTVPFSSKNESEGTKKLVHILGPIYDTIRGGRILFIDEFESKFHPNLSKSLLKLLNEFNLKNAQFIVTSHDSSLLSNVLLRRDQIWFIEKDQYGASKIFPLSDFDSETVRSKSAYDKKYLQNEFGAADPFVISESLKKILYE